MANGIPSLNPFPQFGGQQSPGVTPVKLAPAAVRFPTARRQAPRRSVEPTTKEKLAPLAPFLVGGIMDMFQGKPETLTDEQYLQNLGADPENITDVEQASLDAYKLFGPRAEANTFGLDEIANIVASSQMGRGAKDYASTYMAMRKADATKNAQTEQQELLSLKTN